MNKTGNRKGCRLTDEHKRKIGEANRISNLGKIVSEETKKKISAYHKGKQHTLGHRASDETKRKMSEIHKRNGTGKWMLGKKHTDETKRKMGLSKIGKQYCLGRKTPIEVRKKLSKISKRGPEHHAWKGGITSINQTIRHSFEYKLWRESVFRRDNYSCIWCGDKSGNGHAVYLEADHIKPFAYYPELRFAIDNGRTLCRDCHKKTDTYKKKQKII